MTSTLVFHVDVSSSDITTRTRALTDNFDILGRSGSQQGHVRLTDGNLLLIYICNFHVLSILLLIYICKLHWNAL